MIFICPDCGKEVDSHKQMRRCGIVGHEPCVPVDDGTGDKFVEAKKPARKKSDYQSDFYLVGWGESSEPYSVRRRK